MPLWVALSMIRRLLSHAHVQVPTYHSLNVHVVAINVSKLKKNICYGNVP